MLAESFHTLPVAVIGLNLEDLWRIIAWSSQMFVGGILLALPIIISLLFVNVSFGVAARAAPQLQIFGVGFPITIMLGMVLIWVSLESTLTVFSTILADGFGLISQLLRL